MVSRISVWSLTSARLCAKSGKVKVKLSKNESVWKVLNSLIWGFSVGTPGGLSRRPSYKVGPCYAQDARLLLYFTCDFFYIRPFIALTSLNEVCSGRTRQQKCIPCRILNYCLASSDPSDKLIKVLYRGVSCALIKRNLGLVAEFAALVGAAGLATPVLATRLLAVNKANAARREDRLHCVQHRLPFRGSRRV
jgi:hypothetical protein